MPSLPKFSIVTPSFNQAGYLGETLRSVAGQGYGNVEHIVIDGGSTDASAELLRANEDQLKFWVSEKDRGQTHAINKGMAHAEGEILAYLNSDDYYLPGCFEAVAKAYHDHPDADLFVGRCRYVNETGETIGGQFGEISTYEEILDLWHVWWGARQFVQPEVFWTKRIADKVGTFNESLHYVMDYDYWARILKAGGKVVRIDRELTAFRFTPEQKSNQSRAVALELLELIRPWLWDPTTPIGDATRRRLKAWWTYDARFLQQRDRMVASGTPKLQRWASLIREMIAHPRMITCPGFRQSLGTIVAGNSNT